MGKKSPRPPAVPSPFLQAQAEVQVKRLNQILTGEGRIIYGGNEKVNLTDKK